MAIESHAVYNAIRSKAEIDINGMIISLRVTEAVTFRLDPLKWPEAMSSIVLLSGHIYVPNQKERKGEIKAGRKGRKEGKKERKSLGKTLAELVGAPLRNPMRRIERVQFYAAKKNNCTCLIARGGRRRRKRKRRRRRRRRRW